MITVGTIAEVRRVVAEAKAAGKRIGLVPTMGNLHAGHTSLIDAAGKAADLVVVSIFVNPMQFAPTEDLAAYPRTPVEDLAACEAHGAGVVFMPSVLEMYPAGQSLTEVRVSALGRQLCGASRPTHFAGVCTVVAKLFHIVAPDKAFFGAKDFQQTVVIRRMVADLDFPVEIVVCPTVRDSDGLALSSRNSYLSITQRTQAVALRESLLLAERMIGPSVGAEGVIAAMREHLARRAPLGSIDYLRIVDPLTLQDVQKATGQVLVAIAVRFGKTRLIDNVVVDVPSGPAPVDG